MLAALVIAITGVTVIDGTGAPPRPNVTILIEGEHIKAVAAKRIPRNARVIAAVGKFVIPGLWDMHTHALANFEQSFPRLLAQGMTGIRDMHVQSDRPFERMTHARKALVRPHIVAAGVIVDGPAPVWSASIAVRDAESARAAVVRLKREGADFIKVYDLLPRPAYFAIVKESRRLRMPVAGHVPISVTATEADQASIEHLSGIFEACAADRLLVQKMSDALAFWPIDREQAARMMHQTLRSLASEYDPMRCKPLFAQFAKRGVWHCPTLVETSATLPQALQVVGELHRSGVRLLAGTDGRHSIARELELMVNAGLTSMEALQTATKNAGEFLKRRDIGVIRKGALADLVILDADPLADIGNVSRVSSVFMRGRHQSVLRSSVH